MKLIYSTLFTCLFLCLFTLQAYSQDMSGSYRKTADTQLDQTYGNQYPSTFKLYKVSENHYRSDKTSEGDVLEFTVYKNGNKTIFAASNFRVGKSYFALVHGLVTSNGFKGVFTDNNGTMGNVKYTRQ